MMTIKNTFEKVNKKTLHLLQSHLEDLEGSDFLAYAAEIFPHGRLILISSFGTEASILLHMLSVGAPSLPVVFLDTGKLFGETLTYQKQMEKRFDLKNIHILTPQEHDIKTMDQKGLLWKEDSTRCCHIRKVLPMENFYQDHDVLGVITGRKRFQTKARAQAQKIEIVEQQGQPSRFRLNPLAFWGKEEIQDYQKRFEIPPHPLFKEGYRSIGCMPCSAPSKGYRDGRWQGRKNKECGLHG